MAPHGQTASAQVSAQSWREELADDYAQVQARVRASLEADEAVEYP